MADNLDFDDVVNVVEYVIDFCSKLKGNNNSRRLAAIDLLNRICEATKDEEKRKKFQEAAGLIIKGIEISIKTKRRCLTCCWSKS